MVSFAVELDALERLVEQVARFDAAAQELVDDLESSVRRMHGSWSGAAAEAHLRAHRDWCAASDRMRSAAARLGGVAATARANYTAAVDAGARMWG